MDTNKRIKIAVVHTTDPKDKKAWSGVLYHAYQSLQTYCGDVYYIGPLQTSTKKLFYVLTLLLRRTFKKNYSYDHNFLVSKIHARLIKNKLSGQDFDVIFAFAAATELAYLDIPTPIIYLTDCTFSLLSNTHYFPNLLNISEKEGNYLEESAIKKSDLIIYSSNWAKNSAINDYQADSKKVHVVPFGANIEMIPPKKEIFTRNNNKTCHLLFLAGEWERKGGKIAFETLLNLINMGVDSKLTVCGCIPPKKYSHENMEVIPFLDRNNDDESKILDELMLNSNFLILPTRYDCTPISICDASAFGLPTISTDTGGVSGVVFSGENGFLLDLNSQGVEYARLIKKIFEDEEKYQCLIKTTRETYENKLNWDLWGTEVSKLINRLINK